MPQAKPDQVVKQLPAPPALLINEFYPNTEGRDEAEFIELINLGNDNLNLDGFELRIGDKKRIKLQGLTDKKYIVLWKKGYGFSLRNKGEIVVLTWQNKEIHKISYQNKAPAGKSFAKIGDRWYWTQPTPSEDNILIETEQEAAMSQAKKNERKNQFATDPHQLETVDLDEKSRENLPANIASFRLNPFLLGLGVAIILSLAVIFLLR